jgi:fructokinase
MKSITGKFKISEIVVTMGVDGAKLFMDGKILEHEGFKVDVVDTVGSGDAFLAGLLSKMLDNGTNQDALEFASGLGAFIASKRGACPDYDSQNIQNFIRSKKDQTIQTD